MPRSRRTRSPRCCSRKSSSSNAANNDTTCAQFNGERPDRPGRARRRMGPGARGRRRPRLPAQDAAHDGRGRRRRAMGGDGRGAARSSSRTTKGGTERILNQDEIDSLLGFSLADVIAQRPLRHPRDHQLGDGVLRAPADAGNRLRPPGAVDDDEPAQFHLGQRRSLARPHHLGALRRLSQFDSAAGDPRRVQGGGVGQFRALSRSIRA